MIQTHKNFEQETVKQLQNEITLWQKCAMHHKAKQKQAEDETIIANKENDRLLAIIKDIHTCARNYEWGNYYKGTAEGFVYAITKREVMK